MVGFDGPKIWRFIIVGRREEIASVCFLACVCLCVWDGDYLRYVAMYSRDGSLDLSCCEIRFFSFLFRFWRPCYSDGRVSEQGGTRAVLCCTVLYGVCPSCWISFPYYYCTAQHHAQPCPGHARDDRAKPISMQSQSITAIPSPSPQDPTV